MCLALNPHASTPTGSRSPLKFCPKILYLNSLSCTDSFGICFPRPCTMAIGIMYSHPIAITSTNPFPYHHHQLHHHPQRTTWSKVAIKAQRAPSPKSWSVDSLHPFLTGKQVGTKNSLPPTYFQGLKVSVFHIDCFDAVKCKLQFL